MKTFKYTLDKSSKKFPCPECGKKSLVRYVDIEGSFAADTFGRCDREVNCGYVKRPDDDAPVFVPYQRPVQREPSFIPQSLADGTYGGYIDNNFYNWLLSKFGPEETARLVSQYRFGVDNSSPYTKDWIIFWQYDINNRIRSGKMIRYKTDGHRDKDCAAGWFHKRVRGGVELFPDFNLKQCLFGEHLLSSDQRPVAIVESEKTAIIASSFLPKYLWLACGGITQLSDEKAASLRGRSVTLFPDIGSEGKNGDLYIDKSAGVLWEKAEAIWVLTNIKKSKWDDEQTGSRYRLGDGPPKSAYDKWAEKARAFNWNISDHIERIATPEDREQGLDLADFLFR